MELKKQVFIPEQSRQPVDTANWERRYRQVFWLSDGRRDTQRIAELLHSTPRFVESVLLDLQKEQRITIRRERKVLVMNIALLKQSFSLIEPKKQEFAHSFYERLFTDYPETKALFQYTNMRRQESSLMAMLSIVIAGVERGENLTPILYDLGERHGRYGARPDSYPLVGACLIETFNEYLGAKFTPEMREAWSEAYEIISTNMIEGATEAK